VARPDHLHPGGGGRGPCIPGNKEGKGQGQGPKDRGTLSQFTLLTLSPPQLRQLLSMQDQPPIGLHGGRMEAAIIALDHPGGAFQVRAGTVMSVTLSDSPRFLRALMTV